MFNHEGVSYDSIVAKEDLLKTFEGFHERYLHLLNRAPPGSIRAWPLLRVEPVSTWVKGNVVLVGDAAHPMWPCE
jgi:salicylate hydroxylase